MKRLEIASFVVLRYELSTEHCMGKKVRKRVSRSSDGQTGRQTDRSHSVKKTG